jgi:hypothetical protein
MTSLRPFRLLCATSLAAAALGCRPRAPPGVLVVAGPRPYVDPAAARTGRGALVVAVRASDTPERGLEEAAVSVEVAGGGGRAARGAWTAADGVARLDSVPAGAYVLRVRRIGYKAHAVPVTVRADCPQRVEVYLEPAPSCLFDCPQVPARATITTCAPAT